jgi:hypothetical protein
MLWKHFFCDHALFFDLVIACFAGGTVFSSFVHLCAMLDSRLAFLSFSAGVLPKEITWLALRTVEGITRLVGLAVHLFLETQLFSVVGVLFVSASTDFATRIQTVENGWPLIHTVRYITFLRLCQYEPNFA